MNLSTIDLKDKHKISNKYTQDKAFVSNVYFGKLDMKRFSLQTYFQRDLF